MPEPQEHTPLLDTPDLTAPDVPIAAQDNADAALLHALDAEHDPDDMHDHPPTPSVRAVKSHLMTAAAMQPGHSVVHDAAHSPSLLLRLRQAIDHGVHNVVSAARCTLHRKAPRIPAQHDPVASRHATVRAVFVMAVFTMLVMTAVSPTLLLYMNNAGFTTPTNIAPYVVTSTLSTAVPVVSNLAITALASSIGPGRALAIGALVAAFGIALFLLARHSLILFMIGYGLYASCNSFRVVRVSLLSKVVPPKDRTTVLATHALMTPLGALAGPLLWISAQTYRNGHELYSLGPFSVVMDRFSIVYILTLVAMFIIYLVAATRLRNIVPYSAADEDGEKPVTDEENQQPQTAQNNSGADTHSGRLHPAVVRFSDGHEETVDLQKYRNYVFAYFCFIMLGVNLSAGIYMTAFQPVLVNEFDTSDAKLGAIYEAIAIFAVIPPLVVALLSRYLMDRHILVIGLMIKLIGMVLFLPLFGPVRETQVIIGFLLIIKASIFFSTASMSLFTKILGPMSTSFLLGVLASASSVGPAFAQILLSSRIVTWFGSILFGLFALPSVASLLMIIWPRNWRRLNPSCEYISLVTHEAELQQSEA